MVSFPQLGGCLCRDVRYRVDEDPVTLYVCHCTDCQTQSGSSFALTMVSRKPALHLDQGAVEEIHIELPDGRVKRSEVCTRCRTRVFARSRLEELAIVEPGTLDDTSWLDPAGHIWTRSAQPWVRVPDGLLRFERQPSSEEYLALVRAWKQRESDRRP